MTLAAYLATYNIHAGSKARGGDQYAVEALNAGWQHAAEDVMGLDAYYYDTLVKGQSEYVLPDEVIKVHKVRLLDGTTLKAELFPSAPEEILHRDDSGEVAESVPSACAVALLNYRGGTTAPQGAIPAARSLRFNCPPNWGKVAATDTNNDLEFYCSKTSAFLKSLIGSPDLPHSLGQAGLWWALFLVTKDRVYLSLYNDAIRTYLRTGVGNEPRQMMKPGFSNQRRF